MTILNINNLIKTISSSIVGVNEVRFIENTSDIENYLTTNSFIKVFFHLNPSNFSVNNNTGNINSFLNYRIIVVDLLMTDSSNYESSINQTQLTIEEILYKLIVSQDNRNNILSERIQLTNSNYPLNLFINEFSVKVCGWYVDIQIYKDINIDCSTSLPNTLLTELGVSITTEDNNLITL